MALVTSDEQDEAHVYYRVDDYNLQDGGKLLVRDPSFGALAPITTNYLSAGATGRLKYALVDFDRDGLGTFSSALAATTPCRTTSPGCQPARAGTSMPVTAPCCRLLLQ